MPAYAADNGCFSQGERFNLDAFLRWLDCLPSRERCLFAVAPDVMGDARATLARSLPVLPRLRGLGYRAALVAQDGLTGRDVPWGELDALFTGGTTTWKLSEAMYALARFPRQRGVWTHMGRVNSACRLRAAAHAGYDSADGTYLQFGPDENLPKLLRWLREIEQQPALPLWATEREEAS